MFGEIQAFLKLNGMISEQIEYWKEYKGKTISIRSHSIKRKNDLGSSFSQTSYIIRGKVDDVKSFPPGFLLTNVTEEIHVSDFEIIFSAESTSSEGIRGAGHSEDVLRRIDEKFVSFDSIEEIEMGPEVDSAEEPYRREDLD